MPRVAPTLAVATTSAFAAAALLSQTVIVPLWRAMPPAEFLHQFGTSGTITGATIFPFEVASMVTLTLMSRRGVMWMLAALCMLGTLLTLIYFLPADLALLPSGFPPRLVGATLATWSGWNWLRTALGLSAAVLASLGMIGSHQTH